MNNGTPIIPFPHASPEAIFWTLLAFAGLMSVAIAVEMMRRAKRRREQVEAQWRLIEDIIREKDMPKKEQDVLRDFIRRRAPHSPLKAVTVRQQFDECVEAEMDALAHGNSREQFAAMGIVLRDIRSHLALDYIPFGQRIHSTRELGINQQIWIAQADGERTKWIKGTVSAVDEAYFHLSLSPGGDEGPPEPGDSLRCKMWREDDARYVFSTRCVDLVESPPRYSMEHTSGLNRNQSRAHYRMRFDATTDVEILNAPADGDLEGLKLRLPVTTIRGRITSLSAGGYALVVQQNVSKQVMLRISLDLPGSKPFKAEAQIVATGAISGGRILVRAAFVGMDEETRDIIARYVFQQQPPVVASKS